MATAVVMPKLGNSVESSIIVRWLKTKGDTVAEGDTLCEVETDKAVMEVPSTVSGTLLEIFFREGDDVPVMTPIVAIGQPGESIGGLGPAGVIDSANPHPPAPSPSGRGGENQGVSPVQAVAPQGNSAGLMNGDIEKISPRARNLAERKGLPMAGLQGSGPGGRIIERDIQAALTSQPRTQPRLTPLARSMVASGDFAAPPQGSGAGGRITTKDLQPTSAAPGNGDAGRPTVSDEVTTIPVRGTRKIIASRMLNSMQTTAQLTLNASADARALQEYRKRLKTSAENLGLQKVTINDLALFVVSRTLLQFPDLNALFSDETISQYKNVHLGVAVDTPRGLIVPVIRNAQALNLKQMSQEAARLAAACQAGNISPDELNGATFTVTNLGSLGIESFTPILNPPQVAILGVGNINLKPVEGEDGIEFIPHLSLSLTINHQVVDGAPGARFLQALSRNIVQLDVVLAL